MRGIGALCLLLGVAASTAACQHELERTGGRGPRDDSAIRVVVTQLTAGPVHRHIRLDDTQHATYGLRLAFNIANTSDENVVVGRCSGSALDVDGGRRKVYAFAPVHVIDDGVLLRPGESRKGLDYEPRIKSVVRAAAIRTVDRLKATCAAYPWKGPPPISDS
jgi:hypothetical protein